VFVLPESDGLPAQLQSLLQELWQSNCDPLYNNECLSFMEGMSKLLDALCPAADEVVGHRRLVYLAWALGLGVLPTITHALPKEKRPYQILHWLEQWSHGELLFEQITQPDLFPELTQPTYTLAVDEALCVFVDLPHVLDKEQAHKYLLDIFDLIFDGYAMSVDASEHTDIMGWMLMEVIPAIYHCRLPEKIRSLEWPWPPVST
jgi:hypothetical protein